MPLDPQRTIKKEEDGEEFTHYLLNLTDEQWAAWNVASFMGVRQHGSARLRPFTVSPHEAYIDRLRAELNDSRGGRWTPPGDYIMLSLRNEAGDWYTMMSDTPDEANDHAEVIHMAWQWGGRVLIHGLGLGCVLSAVLASPHVTHVDVVEINEDVIALVGPYFQSSVDEGRLTIHHDNCATKRWTPGTRWSIVWHDIWSQISEDNLLDDSEAEWGISYATMHRKFGGRCIWQGSWGWKQARWMRDYEDRIDRQRRQFVFRWNNLWTPERRLEEILKLTCGILTPEQQREALSRWRTPDDSQTMLEQYEEWSQREITESQVFMLFADR